MGLTTTTAGWFPKSRDLKKARWLYSEEEIDSDKLREAEDLATRQTLELQESLGITVAVDGQMERSDMVGHFAENLEGMGDGLLVRCWGNRYYRRPRIEDAIVRSASITAPRFAAASAMTGGKLKAVLTGPYTLMDWSFDEHYGSRDECCRAFADVVRAEAEDLLSAGATEIQIDEPAISARPDEMGLAASALGHVTEPLRGKARTWAHVGFGDLLPVLSDVLTLPVDGLYLEMANSRFNLLEGLDGWPADKLLTAGVFDVTTAAIESVDDLKGRIERLLAVIPAAQLSIGPDAALRSLTQEQARAKLQNLVEAAGHF
jgi:5-methyltetrahydropteroyltriglutamate--homocysteine methyltransferase